MSFLDFFTASKVSFDDGLKEFHSEKNGVLLDVRTPEEYKFEGHVPGSVNLPLDRLSGISIDKSSHLFVYCYSGARSGQAARYLKQLGYTVTDLGGITSYSGSLE